MIFINATGATIPAYVQLIILTTLGLIVISAVYLCEDDVFSPLGFLGLAYLIGWFGPAVEYAVRGDTNGFLLGNHIGYLVMPMVLSVVAVTLIVVGYVSPIGSNLADSVPKPTIKWDGDRAVTAVKACCVIGTVSLIVFFYTSVGWPSSLSSISSKRNPPTAYIWWGTDFYQIAAIILFLNIVKTGESLRSRRGYELVVLVFLGSITPFVSSSRSDLLWFFILLLVFYHYTQRRLKVAELATAGIIIAGLAKLMLGLRKMSYTDSMSPVDLPEYLLSMESLGSIGARGNEITILSHIYHQVPEQLSPMYGETLLYPLIFPISRDIWESKPENIGSQLGTMVYDHPSGFPPTLIGELYINFLTPGVVLGVVIFGILLRFGYEYCNPMSDSEEVYYVLYILFAIHVAHRMFIGHVIAIIPLVQWIISLTVILLYISGKHTEYKQLVKQLNSQL